MLFLLNVDAAMRHCCYGFSDYRRVGQRCKHSTTLEYMVSITFHHDEKSNVNPIQPGNVYNKPKSMNINNMTNLILRYP